MTVLRLYNPTASSNKVAVVSTQESSGQPGTFTVQVARGPRRGKLTVAGLFGPFNASELAARVSEVVAQLEAEGYGRGGLVGLRAALYTKNVRARARAAGRLGWRRDPAGVEPLIAAMEWAADDRCAIVDALGAIGDARAIPVVRAEAERKLLSRRRSGVEALWHLGDAEGLAAARARALERLPGNVRQELAALDEESTHPVPVQKLVSAVLAVDLKDRGLAVDTLYELGTPLTVTAALAVLTSTDISQPHVWRYAKSVFKRAMLRHDPRAFALLAHQIEMQGRLCKGHTANVKSGYDGQVRATKIFQRTTQDYLRRLAWRYLRRLAAHRPELYTHAAAEAVAVYTPEELTEPKKLHGITAESYLLHRVLFGASERFKFDARTMKFAFKKASMTAAPKGAREEAFAHLWDLYPSAYLRILGRSKLEEAHRFAVAGIERGHLDVLAHASHDEIVPLLGAPYEPTVSLGLAELRRRFDPKDPDWSLLARLLADGRPHVRALGFEWITLTAPLWTRDVDQITRFLAIDDAGTRSKVAELAVAALRAAPAEARRTLAERVVATLRTKEKSQGAHEGFARVGREALTEELNALLDVPELLAWLSHGSNAAKGVAAEVLARRADGVAALGWARVTAMAAHELAAVRAAACGLIKRAADELRTDPSVLFTLADSEWEDTRRFAVAMLRDTIDVAALGLDGVVGLCDSNRAEVQALGRELVMAHLHKLDAHELIKRLAQHPDSAMRRFALDLVVDNLKEGFIQVARLEDFFRTLLFELWPARAVKRKLVRFLGERGLRDERQAEVAGRLLGEFVKTRGVDDRDNALEALVRIKLAFPAVDAGLTLPGVDAAVKAGAATGAGAAS